MAKGSTKKLNVRRNYQEETVDLLKEIKNQTKQNNLTENLLTKLNTSILKFNLSSDKVLKRLVNSSEILERFTVALLVVTILLIVLSIPAFLHDFSLLDLQNQVIGGLFIFAILALIYLYVLPKLHQRYGKNIVLGDMEERNQKPEAGNLNNYGFRLGWFSRHVVVTAIIAGIISSAIVLTVQYMTAPKPHINITFFPGTEYFNEQFIYKNFYILLVNNGTAPTNYLSLFLYTPTSSNGVAINYEIYLQNLSTQTSTNSCGVDKIAGDLMEISLSNFGPENRCQIMINVTLLTSSQMNYTINGKNLGNYTNLTNYFNEDYTRLFNVTSIVSDSKYNVSCQLSTPLGVSFASGSTSVNGNTTIPLQHQVGCLQRR